MNARNVFTTIATLCLGLLGAFGASLLLLWAAQAVGRVLGW